MDSVRKTDDVGGQGGDTGVAMATDQSGDAAAKKTESKNLDLAFAMDCTGSMGSYIHQAQQNIRLIVEEIVSKEKADVCLALVEYRDHPPEDSTFVTRVNDFTTSVRTMKQWLDKCSAYGGGDTPEAVADALHQVAKLQWREDSTKICVFIADAPPHGLSRSGDGFPNGCPDGLDPMVVTRELAEKGITLYMVGCEPSITPYRDFFMALAHLTGGQYVPLTRADVLAKVIVGGAQEELSLQQLMEEVNLEVVNECAVAEEDIDSEELTRKVHMKLKSKGKVVKQLQMNTRSLAPASESAKKLSYANTMREVQGNFTKIAPPALPEMVKSRRVKRKMAKKSTSGGLVSFFTKRSSKAKEEEEDDAEEEIDTMGASMEAPFAMENYEVVEDELNLAQASRLVQRSIATNRLQAKMKK